MQIDIMSFTRRGIELSAKIRECLYSCGKGYEVCLYTKYGRYQEISDAEIQTEWIREHNRANGKNPVYVKESIYDWMRARFEQNRNGKKTAVIWIGACGIAVRAMAPSLRDKLTDIPVLVVDEAGQFVIPVLSGHYGGANELAGLLAKRIGAVPVITTATDVNHAFAVDVFAKENGLFIQNKEEIAGVSSKILDGKKIMIMTGGRVEGEIPKSVLISDITTCEKNPPQKWSVKKEQDHISMPDVVISARYPVKNIPKSQVIDEQVDVKTHTDPLWLIPRTIILGMGCKKGKSCEEIGQFVLETLEQEQISIQAVTALATIDLKKEEPGFLEFVKKYGLDFLTYPKEVLKEVPGTFSGSAFVSQTVGVDNVCERAALAACRKEDKEKIKQPGCGSEGKEKSYMQQNCDSRENQKKMLVQGRLLLKKKAKDGMTLAIAEREWSVRFDET